MTMITPWSFSSLILGFHVVNGVLAGIRMSPHGKQVIAELSESIPHLESRQDHHHNTNAIPHLPHFLGRRVDIKKLVPRKKHLRPQRLMRRIGKDFDTFWMSQRIPKDFSKILTKNNIDPSLSPQTSSLDVATLANKMFTSMEESIALSANNDSSSNVNSSTASVMYLSADEIVPNFVDNLNLWLSHLASCPVYYKWEDLGLLYWPRWVRKGLCSGDDNRNPLREAFKSKASTKSSSESSSSCSWPPGMHCVPSKGKKLKVLRWTCKHSNSKLLEEMYKLKRNSRKNKANDTSTTSFQDVVQTFFHKDDHHEFEDDHHDDFDHHVDNEEEFHHSNDKSDIQDKNESMAASKEFRGLFSKTTKEDNVRSRDKRTRHHKFHKSLSRLQSMSEKRDKNARDGSTKLVNTTPSRAARRLRQTTSKSFDARILRRMRRDSKKSHHKPNHHHNNHHNHHGKSNRKGRKRNRSGFRCRWVKITYPVINDCYCSC